MWREECIRALDQQLDHTPFRGSKLTQAGSERSILVDQTSLRQGF